MSPCCRGCRRSLLAGLLCSAAPLGVSAGTVNVPEDFPSIQAAINAAVEGSEIIVAPGTYFENIDFLGKGITLRSSGGREVTTIDGGGTGSVVTSVSNEGPNTVLDGFTITNGSAPNGGGMLLFMSDPTVLNCAFEDNHVTATGPFSGLGGGLVCNQSSPVISNCSFTLNSATGGPDIWSGLGGGVCCVFGSHAVISGCTFTQNTVTGGPVSPNPTGHGGGFFAGGGSSPTITDCDFIQNRTIGTVGGSGFGAGAYFVDAPNFSLINCLFRQGTTSGPVPAAGAVGGVHLVSSNGTIRDCDFEENFSANDLAGALLLFNSSPDIIGCRFVGNWTTHDQAGALGTVNNSNPMILGCSFLGNSSTMFGGAMVVGFNSGPEVIDCLFAGNASSYGGAIWCGVPPGGDPSWFAFPTFTNCTIADNVASIAGGGLYSTQEFGGVTLPAVKNSIMWSNTPNGLSDVDGALTTVDYSNIQGGWPGTANIDEDPLFADRDGPDGDPITLNDNNYRLSAGSGCIDTGNSSFLPSDFADLDQDGNFVEPLALDLAGKPRLVNDPVTPDCVNAPGTCGSPPVDMGAYELQLCPADLDGNGTVDAADLALMLGVWGPDPSCPPHAPADLNADCLIDAADLALLLGDWGPCC